MNIALFSNYTYTPHFETELELIQMHLDQGDTVYHFVCDMHLLSCDFNPNGDLLKCISCISKRTKGQKLLINTKKYHEIKISKPKNKILSSLPELDFNSIAELRQYKIENFEIGDAALSSLVSIVRDPEPDLKVFQDMLSRIILSAHYCYHFFQSELQAYSIDTFYNFNGRFATNRAALRAAQKTDVSTFIHERGHNFNYYELFDNVLPHEITSFIERVTQSWENHPDDSYKNKVAHDFYKNRAIGKDQGWVSFTKDQKKGLPDHWDDSIDNIVIFNSSEDEYVSIGKDWDLGGFESQNKLILKLIHDSSLSEKKIWVRLHPNMQTMAKKYLEKTYATLQGNIEVILPESPINSYDLMNAADKIVTFGSTTGIEATYWGKPSILLGPSFYKAFEATYNPETYEELIWLLLDQDLKPKKQENTLPFGFHTNNFGIPFKIYKPKNLFEGEFKGVDLKKHFDYAKWEKFSHKRGIHWFYHKLNMLNHKLRLKKYV
ncbi:hypothetical protein [Flavobacterium sp.]|uniref:capsular polysaccharide export protein, LipB/KpsS family n=1 Tax=Flavobacterium sp. TaxID=239 RepID=UPI00286BC870|nr:hypothetical protein [Flavobacterium sp.]